MRIFRTRGRIRREAANWVARLSGGAGEGDHAAFRAWYEADPRHREAYDRMAALWSASGKLSMPESSRARQAAGGNRRLGYAIAASFLALVAVALLLLRGNLADGRAEPGAAYATAHGELRQVVLPDGSRLTLDAGSGIEVRFSDSERRLVLREGRARFAVARESRPFVVAAGTNEVVATGTVFDVSLLGGRLAVVLLEGSVELRQGHVPAPRAVHRLTPGRRLIVEGESAPVVAPAARGDTSWADRMLEFDDTPLGEAVAVANRYGRVRIRLADERLAALRVTGAYRAGDTEGLARSLAAAFDLDLATAPEGNLILSRRRPGR